MKFLWKDLAYKIEEVNLRQKSFMRWTTELKPEFVECLTNVSVWLPLSGNTKRGSITVPLTSCLTGLESAVWLLTIFVFIGKTEYSKPVKQEVNSTVILPLLVFPAFMHYVYDEYLILLSIVCTFLHWKWCWNIPCALYMEGSWEGV